ncbi:hypothetical protein T484DRAFT_1745225 [Baffinella frigidus]|nr:hypothetical protein T484DRAFT_1745225 [Cryptophyta sp. CCMP2293]
MADCRWLLLTLLAASSLGSTLPPPGISPPVLQRCAGLRDGLRGGGEPVGRGPELFINSYTDAVYAKMRDDTVRTEGYRAAIKALAPNRTVRDEAPHPCSRGAAWARTPTEPSGWGDAGAGHWDGVARAPGHHGGRSRRDQGQKSAFDSTGFIGRSMCGPSIYL